MNKQEYKEYEASVASFHKDHEEYFEQKMFFLSPKSDRDGILEPHFSWRQCECCKSLLGGDRYRMETLVGSEIFEYEFCVDCLYYNEYGRLDDMTMLDMED